MPKDSHAKTASAPKYLFFGGILLLIFALLANPVSRQRIDCFYFHTPVNSEARVHGKVLRLEKVATEAAREKGLSDRPCIKDNQAMLFVFDKQDMSNHCFWMQDMRFPIDILWLDETKRVVYSMRDVEPATYPVSFCPNRPSSYVLELKAHASDRLNLSIGTQLSF